MILLLVRVSSNQNHFIRRHTISHVPVEELLIPNDVEFDNDNTNKLAYVLFTMPL